VVAVIVEAVAWTVVALVVPDAVLLSRIRWGARIGDGLGPIRSIGRWVCNLGIPYLALISGAISARDAGLTGLSGVEWLRGAILCAGILAVAAILAGWGRGHLSYVRPDQAALDEPRWALYRGTGSLLADPHWAGPLIGLGIGLAEWSVRHRLWAGRAWPGPEVWSNLTRVCASTALFLLTRNLWLIVLTQAGLSLVLAGTARGSAEGGA
jgi:hypothetical protein